VCRGGKVLARNDAQSDMVEAVQARDDCTAKLKGRGVGQGDEDVERARRWLRGHRESCECGLDGRGGVAAGRTGLAELDDDASRLTLSYQSVRPQRTPYATGSWEFARRACASNRAVWKTCVGRRGAMVMISSMSWQLSARETAQVRLPDRSSINCRGRPLLSPAVQVRWVSRCCGLSSSEQKDIA
jgi:hypothetical protein